MNRKVLFAVLVVTVSFMLPVVAGQAEEGGGPPLPPARQVPGITADDMFPNACVDCHINMTDINLDVRLSSIFKRWTEKVEPKFVEKAQSAVPKGMKLKGKHPALNDGFKDIPATCLECHSKTSKQAPPFDKMMHGLHLTGGGENPFMTLFQGECTHCHKLNQSTGGMSIPSAPEK